MLTQPAARLMHTPLLPRIQQGHRSGLQREANAALAGARSQLGMKCAWVCPQNTKPADRSALNAQCEPLLAVAEAHAEGKEAFARSIATELFSDFLSVEERFAANKEATEQEVIDQLRQVILHIVLLPATQASLFYTLFKRGGEGPSARNIQ